MNNKYILGIDSFNNKVFSVCIFDVENNSFVISKSGFDEKEFKKWVKELSKHYNCERIEEFEIKEPTKDRVYAKVPSLSQAIENYLKTDKGKQAMKEYFTENNCIDYNLVEELINFKNKKL